MDIYFKELYGDNEFQLLEDKIINLNNTILKVICNENIKEVIIGDEKFNCNEKNEIDIFKLRTSLKDKIEIKVVEISNNKEKIHKKIIKIEEDSFIYNSMELDKIKQLGDLAYKNITSGLSNGSDDYYETIINNLSEGLKNIDEIYAALVKIVKLGKDIGCNPKVDLVQTEEVRDSNEVKKISSNSARYFIMHPEDWFKEGDAPPKPIKLLTDSFDEDKDIYENQLIKYILYKCKRIVNSKITLLQASKSTLKTNLIIGQEKVADENEYSNFNMEDYEDQKIQYKLMACNLKKFEALKVELNRVYDLFKDVSLNKRIKFRMTQKILYDKRYLRVVQLFKKYLRKLEESNEEVFERQYTVLYSYMFIIAESICKALQSIGFYDITSNVSCNTEVFESGNMILESTHYNNENEFSFRLELNNILSNDNLIKLKLKYNGKEENIVITINSLFNYKKIDEDEVENLYRKYTVKDNVNTHLIVNTAALEELSFISEEVRTKLIFKLSNLGNNFIYRRDYENYGGFKVGMIPLSLNDLTNMFDKLVNLMYLKFIKIGFYNYCRTCASGVFEEVEEGLLKCSICGQKVAINTCSCGEKIIKILSKESKSYLGEYEKTDDIIEKHKNYELRSNTLGACYENYKSNSGGFCSKCGRCQKAVGNCLRCSLGDLEEK